MSQAAAGAAALLAALLSLLAARRPGLQGLLGFYAALLAHKSVVVAWLPEATSWCALLGSWDPYPALAAFSGYPLAAAALLQARRLGVEVDGGPLRLAVAAALGAAAGYAVRGPGCPLQAYLLTAATWSVYGGVAEELYFRGSLLKALEQRLGRPLAVAAQAAAFGLSHPWDTAVAVAAALFGLVLGVLRLRLGLTTCIGLHYGMNVFTHA